MGMNQKREIENERRSVETFFVYCKYCQYHE